MKAENDRLGSGCEMHITLSDRSYSMMDDFQGHFIRFDFAQRFHDCLNRSLSVSLHNYFKHLCCCGVNLVKEVLQGYSCRPPFKFFFMSRGATFLGKIARCLLVIDRVKFISSFGNPI